MHRHLAAMEGIRGDIAGTCRRLASDRQPRASVDQKRLVDDRSPWPWRTIRLLVPDYHWRRITTAWAAVPANSTSTTISHPLGTARLRLSSRPATKAHDFSLEWVHRPRRSPGPLSTMEHERLDVDCRCLLRRIRSRTRTQPTPCRTLAPFHPARRLHFLRIAVFLLALPVRSSPTDAESLRLRWNIEGGRGIPAQTPSMRNDRLLAV